MRAYYITDTDSEYGIIAVAATARQAKSIVHGVGPLDCDYIDLRVTWLRDIIPPVEITEPTVFESCHGADGWICGAWRYNADYCRGCSRHDEKRRDYYGEEVPYA